MQPDESKMHPPLCIACKSTIHPEATVCPACKTAQTTSRWTEIGSFLKWIGGISAVLSLILTMGQVSKIYQNMQDKEKIVSEFIKIGNLQRDRGNYAAAWDSYAEAITLNPGSHHARDERVQLAMSWMRQMRGAEKNLSFSEIADRLSPVLFRGITLSEGEMAADYIAHLGWATYLKFRDGNASSDEVGAYFDWAISEDPQNAYAHAMLGFWKLLRRNALEDVKSHFKIALASVEAAKKGEIRDLQLSALLNAGGREVEAETLQVADEMRKQGEVISRVKKRQILQIYGFSWKAKPWKTLSAALTPEAHLALLPFLFEGQKPSEKKLWLSLIEAHLYQKQGKSSKALAMYQSIQKSLAGTGNQNSLLKETKAAIAALGITD